ncbi:hypothetical protein EON82_01810 [bacterium]|nr:MAG: hypothetical protein EON82_01810 [bacterium]
MATKGNLLVVEWSPTQVRVFDPITGLSTLGTSVAECVGENAKGRDTVVAISRRSAFVRSMYVPNASRSEIEGVLRMQLERVLPFAPNEYALAFRLGPFVEGKGRLAAIGATKTEHLGRIAEEARKSGLRVRAIVPAAGGAWLAARAHAKTDVAVVEEGFNALSIDIMKEGELRYSRSVPLPNTPEDVEDEIARTFAVAEVDPLPLLPAEDRPSISRLADPVAVTRLFGFETPGKREAKATRSAHWKKWRAIAAMGLAVGLAGYAYSIRLRQAPKTSPEAVRLAATLRDVRKDGAKVNDRLARTQRAEKILDVAFRPSQSMGDVVTAVANATTDGAWFTSLIVGRGTPVAISGLALKDSDVTTFMNGMGRDPRFQGMKVVTMGRTAMADTPLTQFYVTGSAVGMMPFDRPLKKERKDVKAKP